MPNWCDTTYKCVGDKKELRALKKVLDSNFKRKKTRVPNGFGKCWIGNIIDQLGYDWHKYRCRGEITDYSLDGEVLTINQQTAWCEQEGFRQVIEEKFASLKVYYQEQEPGCEVFSTNSFEYFPEHYFLDSYEDWEYFKTIDEVAEHVKTIVGHEVEAELNAIQKELDAYVEDHDSEDLFYSLHEFTEVSD